MSLQAGGAAVADPTHRAASDARPRRLRWLWAEHGYALLGFLLLSLGLTWPLPRSFTTAITGVWDARQFVWLLWHTREALLGHEPFYWAPFLYYPHGTTLITFSAGPAGGVIAFPLFALGPEAAYNGALLAGFVLSGWAMYVLARGLGFDRGVAFFAGVVYTASPTHLSALTGHFHKAFVVAAPLVLLATSRALDLARSRWWAVAAAGAMLLALFESGEQYLFGGVAIAFLSLVRTLGAPRGGRAAVLGRGELVVAATVALSAPLLIEIFRVLGDPELGTAKAREATLFQPDVLQLLLPPWFSWFGPWGHRLLTALVASPADANVSIPLAAIALCLLAAAACAREARPWLGLAALFACLTLGPSLKVFGRQHFTPFGLPIVLPFAFLAYLPGFGVIRATDRFMLMGAAGIAIGASFGLAWLRARVRSGVRLLVLAAATTLVLVEVWPRPWDQEKLRPVPDFYRRIADDPETYGVFDLPIRPLREIGYQGSYVVQSAYYQLFQMTHRKGIASGYVSRYYARHPVFPQIVSDSVAAAPAERDLFVNGRPTSRYANAQYELARNGYRYVVFHKARPEYPEAKPPAWGLKAARLFIASVFGDAAPIVDDKLVRVYAVDQSRDTSKLETTIALRESAEQSWLEVGSGRRWATSPASFYVASPRRQPAWLEVTPGMIFDPATGKNVPEASLTLLSESGPLASAPLATGRTTSLPLMLEPGAQTVSLRVDAVTPRPGARASDRLRFAIRSINLVTETSP